MEIGCGEQKGCFGYPSGCVKSQKCAMLATYKYIHVPVDNVNRSSGYNSTIDQIPRGKFDMQLQLDTSFLNFSRTSHPLPFVAMAFSFDRLMGEDSEDGRIIKTWHDNIEEAQLKVSKFQNGLHIYDAIVSPKK